MMKGLNIGQVSMFFMDLLGVLVGRTEDEDDAEKICGIFDDCPYCVMNVVKERMLVLLFSIPEDHRWWLEGIEKEPERTLGLSQAEIFFSERFDDLKKKIVSREEPPCGSDCESCESYLEECSGCPSVFASEEKHFG